MNKICTYVGTTICTIFFLLATAQGQNNKPILTIYTNTVETMLHQPDTVHISEFAADPDGDYIYIVEFYTESSNGVFTKLSDSTFKYEPYMPGCGPSSVSVKVCDTSTIYQNSLCDTLDLYVSDDCSWPPVALSSQYPADTVCDGETVLYAPSTSGGSNAHRITLISSNPNDVFARDPYDIFNTTTGIMTYNGFGERYVTVMIEDQNSQEVVSGIPYTTVNIYPSYSEELDTNSWNGNIIGIIPTYPEPGYWNHTLTWLDNHGSVIKSNLLNAQSTGNEINSAKLLPVDTPGFYTIIITNHTTGCTDTTSGYFAGMNHPISAAEIPFVEIFVPSGSAPVVVETSYTGGNEYENDLDNGRIRFTDTVTSPSKGIITYANGDMYYAANNQCGFDTFFAIGCDTSNFLPHTTCDTLMVIMEIECSISAQAFVVQNASCNAFGDGAASVTVQGSNINPASITYLWSNGATTQTINGLAAGTYSVTVTYQNSATATSTAIVTQPQALQPSIQAQNTCGVSCSGSATVSIVGGTAPYTYIWSHNSTAPNLSNLCIGTYAGTITDAMGCTVSPVFTILQDTSPITINLTEQHIDCDSAFGSITAVVNNGTAPYSYMWSTGESGLFSSIHMLSAGNYSLTVVDANGCAATAITAIINSTGLSASIVDSVLPTCNAVNNGMVQIAPSGGVAPYTYVWTGNASTTNTATGLSAGAHTVVVSDNGGCSFAYQFNLAPQIVLNVSTTAVSANCVPNQPGQVNVLVTNGTPPYSYGWNTGTTGATMQGPAGTYQLTVTDANGCSAVNTASIINHSLFMSTYSQPENCGQNNGRANVIVHNGVSPYSYEWNSNVALNNDTLYNATNGTQTVKVTDALGCYRTVQIEVLADCYAMLEGVLYNDVNGDCIKQVSEIQPIPQSVIAAIGVSNTYYGTIYPNGNYAIVVRDTGNYELGINVSPCFVLCPTAAVNVPALNNSYEVNAIGYTPSSEEHDFRLNISAFGFNPGFTTTYNLEVTSTNNPHNINPSVTFHYSPVLVFATAVGAVVDTVAHTVTWSNVSLGTQNHTNLSASFTLPVGTAIGASIVSSASVQPDSNDCNPQNNAIVITRPVTGSYDPNMKVANPSAEILETDSIIHYTIHFQNTGNDTTHFVILKDTLSALVDPASFEFGGSSHQPCRYEVEGTGIVTFTFDPIYLVDSATNEEASKGYVNYSIKKKPTTEVGEVIRNTAHIYFDFNPAIVTNTTENEVTTIVSIRDVKANTNLTAKVYPNPFAETAIIETSEKLPDAKLVISNLEGQIVQEYRSDNSTKWQISKQSLAQGMYTFTIYSTGKPVLRGKLIAE